MKHVDQLPGLRGTRALGRAIRATQVISCTHNVTRQERAPVTVLLVGPNGTTTGADDSRFSTVRRAAWAC